MTAAPRPGPGARLDVEADLRVEVTDPSGASSAVRVTSDDGGVRVDVARPDVALGALPRRRDAGSALALARGLGVRVDVHGPSGRLAVLDPERPSRTAALLTGVPGLRVTPAAVVAWVRGPGRGVAVVAAVAIAAAVALVAGRRPAGQGGWGRA